MNTPKYYVVDENDPPHIAHEDTTKEGCITFIVNSRDLHNVRNLSIHFGAPAVREYLRELRLAKARNTRNKVTKGYTP